jgi:hypothetical protein
MAVDLSKFNETWASATPPDPGNAERLPDGTYQVVVENLEVTTTKSGRDCVLWTLKVTGPRHAGRKVWHRDFLDQQERQEQLRALGYLKKNLALFGVHCERFEDLPAHFAGVVGQAVEVALKTNQRDYQNAYFNRLVSAPAGNGTTAGNGHGGNAASPRSIATLSPF